MNSRERDLILGQKMKLEKLIQNELALPKKERNQRSIDEARNKISRIKSWLNDTPGKKEKLAPAPEKKRITKKEFVEGFKTEFNVTDTKQTMVISSVEVLRQAWPAIMGQNISIQVPADMDPIEAGLIKAEAKKLHTEWRSKSKKTGGFR